MYRWATSSTRMAGTIASAALAAIWVAVWYLAWAVIQQEILIASPGEVVFRLLQLGTTGDFWVSTLSSLLRIVTGFLLAAAVGCALAVLCHLSSFLYDLFYPVIRIIRATPVASFIILALIWLNTGSVPGKRNGISERIEWQS